MCKIILRRVRLTTVVVEKAISIIQTAEKRHAQTSWGYRPKQRFIVTQHYVGHASLQRHVPTMWDWLRLEIKQNHWSIQKNKGCNSLTIQTRCSKVGASTSIHSRRRRSRHWCVYSKLPSCCLMVAASSSILFIINWRCINQVFHVGRIFLNSHSSHIWPEANPKTASIHHHQ